VQAAKARFREPAGFVYGHRWLPWECSAMILWDDEPDSAEPTCPALFMAVAAPTRRQ